MKKYDYANKQSLFQLEERKWTIHKDHLSWIEDKEKSGEVKFSQIETVRLLLEPKIFESQRYVCQITETSGLKHIITSSSLKGYLNYEPRKQDYRTFVEKLIKALAPYQNEINFVFGTNPKLYKFQVYLMFQLISGLAILMAIASYQSGNLQFAIYKILIFLTVSYLGIAIIKRKKPGTFTPDNLPEHILP